MQVDKSNPTPHKDGYQPSPDEPYSDFADGHKDDSLDALGDYLRMDLVPKFTDDYIDEWTSDNNDIGGLHKIIDSFADELQALIAKAIEQIEIEHIKDIEEMDRFRHAAVQEAETAAYIRGVEDELECVRAGGHTDIFTDHTSSSTKWAALQANKDAI